MDSYRCTATIIGQSITTHSIPKIVISMCQCVYFGTALLNKNARSVGHLFYQIIILNITLTTTQLTNSFRFYFLFLAPSIRLGPVCVRVWWCFTSNEVKWYLILKYKMGEREEQWREHFRIRITVQPVCRYRSEISFALFIIVTHHDDDWDNLWCFG